MAAKQGKWGACVRLSSGIGALALGLSLVGCGDGGSKEPAPPNVKEEIKAGKKEGVEKFLKRRREGGGAGPGVPGDSGGQSPGGAGSGAAAPAGGAGTATPGGAEPGKTK